jgi:hypothetical protein
MVRESCNKRVILQVLLRSFLYDPDKIIVAPAYRDISQRQTLNTI